MSGQPYGPSVPAPTMKMDIAHTPLGIFTYWRMGQVGLFHPIPIGNEPKTYMPDDIIDAFMHLSEAAGHRSLRIGGFPHPADPSNKLPHHPIEFYLNPDNLLPTLNVLRPGLREEKGSHSFYGLIEKFFQDLFHHFVADSLTHYAPSSPHGMATHAHMEDDRIIFRCPKSAAVSYQILESVPVVGELGQGPLEITRLTLDASSPSSSLEERCLAPPS